MNGTRINTTACSASPHKASNPAMASLEQAILDYVAQMAPLISDTWRDKHELLWRNILAQSCIKDTVYDRGSQKNTTFNRQLVTNIIHLLTAHKVYTTNNCAEQARHLEPNTIDPASNQKRPNSYASVQKTLRDDPESAAVRDAVVRLLRKKELPDIVPPAIIPHTDETCSTQPILNQYGANSSITQNTFFVGAVPHTPRPALITQVINQLASVVDELTLQYDTIAFDIQQKIDFNQLEEWSEMIAIYAPYTQHLEQIYLQLDAYNRQQGDRVLNWLNTQYLRLNCGPKGDQLFSLIYNHARDTILQDPSCDPSIPIEDLDDCLATILVDAFMKCRIMQKPVNP